MARLTERISGKAVSKHVEPISNIATFVDSTTFKGYSVGKAIDKLAQYEDLGEPHELQRKQEWISVEDRLPPQAKRVLVKAEYDNARLIAIACLQVNKWIVEGAFPEAEATHWQPLPEPPKA